MKSKPLWQIIWIISFMSCLIYYMIKTFILQYKSGLADSFIMTYGIVSLVIYLYFFQKKRS